MTPLFVFDTKNPPGLGTVPNLNSAGFVDFKNLLYTYTWFVRKDTSPTIQAAIQRDINQAIREIIPELIQKNLATGFQEVNPHAEAQRSSVLFGRLSRQFAK